MKISIISDMHLGFGLNTEMEEDSFKAFEEAVEKSLDCDFILVGGDVFDTRIPNTETFTKAIEILRKTFLKQSEAKIAEGINKKIDESPLIKNGIPIIAISGNHERRVKGLLNPVQALERAGFLVYLHCNGVVIEKGQEKFAVHGMSSIPDQYGEALLSEWNPKPVEGCFNILMLHQSIAPFLIAQRLIPLEKIPIGFDLYINGHVHGTVKTEYSGSPFIIPGSLLPTQITKDLNKHSFCIVETENSKIREIKFMGLEKQREIFYKEFEKGIQVKEIENYMENVLKEKRSLKPIIKIVLHDKTSPVKELSDKYGAFAILYFKREAEEEVKEVATLTERVESVNELGRRLLRENFQKNGIDPQSSEDIFELLENNKIGEAEEVLEKVLRK